MPTPPWILVSSKISLYVQKRLSDLLKKEYKNRTLASLIVPVGLTIVLIPYSLLIGWSLITAFPFWFVITPALAIYLPFKTLGDNGYFFQSFIGLILFYGLMVFMIYDHYETDHFQIMIFSGMVNLILVSMIMLARRPKTS